MKKKKRKFKEDKCGKSCKALGSFPIQINKDNTPTFSQIPQGQFEKIALQEVTSIDSPKKELKWKRGDIIQVIGVVVNALILIGAVVAILFNNKSIKSIEKTFDIENMPYLQVGEIKISGDTVFYSISNLGQYPAKIIQGRFGIIMANLHELSTPIKDQPSLYKGPEFEYDPVLKKKVVKIPKEKYVDSSFINIYIVKEYPFKHFQVKLNLLKEEPKWHYYFFGEIVYQNEVNGDKRKYIFNVDLPKMEFINNQNISE